MTFISICRLRIGDFLSIFSIILSLAKYHYVKHFSGSMNFSILTMIFSVFIGKHFPFDSSKLHQNKWCSLEAMWPIIL